MKVLRWECLEGSKGSRDPGVVRVREGEVRDKVSMVTSQVAVGDYEELDFCSEWNDKRKWFCATKGHDLTYVLRGSFWYLDNRL